MYIDQTNALLAGKRGFGNIIIDFDPEDLTTEERTELAVEKIDNQPVFIVNPITGCGTLPSVSEATVETMRAILGARITGRLAADTRKESDRKERLAKFLESSPESWFEGKGEPYLSMWGFPPENLNPTQAEKLLVDAKIDEIKRFYNLAKIAWQQEEKRKEEIEKQNELKIAAKTQKKHNQLGDAVDRRGTDTQKERWSAGVMPVKEAIDLIFSEVTLPLTLAGMETLPSTQYHVGDSDWDQDETEKRTLSDEEWVASKKIKSTLGDGWTFSTWKQTAKSPEDWDNDDREVRTVVILRCAKMVGEIAVSFDTKIA